jgi:hypothetical protein
MYFFITFSAKDFYLEEVVYITRVRLLLLNYS